MGWIKELFCKHEILCNSPKFIATDNHIIKYFYCKKCGKEFKAFYERKRL